ncbi:MAG: hypothetical protein GX362_06290 [Methanosarcinaceae archaeon]|nr:hypothetical protein [Methanosarcinaceae archaeon]
MGESGKKEDRKNVNGRNVNDRNVKNSDVNSQKPPVFCEKYCIICKGARNGNGLCKKLQDIELKIFGKEGCYWGKARYEYYGVTPDKLIKET